MVRNILDGITKAIYNRFGDDYDIYVNAEEQGVNEPCFFVYLVNSSEDEKIMGRYLQKNLFNIIYFPKNEELTRSDTGYYEPNIECYEVLNILNQILRYVELEEGDVIRGTNISGEVSDNRLTFFVNYDLYVNRNSLGDLMEECTVNAREKG